MQGPSWSPPGYFGRPSGAIACTSPCAQWSGRQRRQDPADLERAASAASGFCDHNSADDVILTFGHVRHRQLWPQTSDSPDIINLGNGLVHSTSTPKKKNPFDSQRYIFLSTYKIYYTTLVGSLVSEPSRAG
jgi:hypothetical protein